MTVFTSIPASLLFSIIVSNSFLSFFSPVVTVAAVLILSSLIAICVLLPKKEVSFVLWPIFASSSSEIRKCSMSSFTVSFNKFSFSFTFGYWEIASSFSITFISFWQYSISSPNSFVADLDGNFTFMVSSISYTDFRSFLERFAIIYFGDFLFSLLLGGVYGYNF